MAWIGSLATTWFFLLDSGKSLEWPEDHFFFFLIVFENKMKFSFSLESVGITACCPKSGAQPSGPASPSRTKMEPAWEVGRRLYGIWNLYFERLTVFFIFPVLSLLFHFYSLSWSLLKIFWKILTCLNYSGGKCWRLGVCLCLGRTFCLSALGNSSFFFFFCVK